MAHDPNQSCEGSQYLPFHHAEPPCARFTPLVEYVFQPDTAPLAERFEVRVAERLHLKNWAQPKNVLTVFRDCDFLESCPTPPGAQVGVADPVGGNPLPRETFLPGVINDGDQGVADNVHQTLNAFVSPPGFDVFTGGRTPGVRSASTSTGVGVIS